MNTETIPDDELTGFDPWTAAVPAELAAHPPLRSLAVAPGLTLDVQAGRDSFWLVARGPGGGGTAFRAAYAPGGVLTAEEAAHGERGGEFRAHTPVGEFRITLDVLDGGLLHWTTRLTPAFDLVLPFGPPDVYPLGAGDDPRGARGTAHAGQPTSGAAALFLTQTGPAGGSAVYLQNLSALQPLLETLGVPPTTLVGGLWPQLGFRLPASAAALPEGKEVVVSDAFVFLSAERPEDERRAARLFLDGLAAVYPHLPQPETAWHDWPGKAAASLRDIAGSDECLVTRLGHTYARPYLAAEEPDSMVQLALTLPLYEYADWTGRPVPLADTLRAGVPAFFDEKLGAVRRYLPDVGDGKDRSESDSWYLYHPLLDLARLARRGDAEAERLLLGALDHAISAARHFQYRWPVKFSLDTLEVLTDVRKPGEPGQSDVGGLYAAVMLYAWDLTGEARYFEEAQAAARALSGYRFAAGYQYNITAIGAAACLRLARETGDDFFRGQSDLLLASFFQHTTFSLSQTGAAKFYPGFLGVLCLHDAQYTAVFEAFESFAAFHEIFAHEGEALSDSVRLLLSEYCRHLLNRAWFYYPGELPEEALATDIRNGHIDRSLAIPLEDLYPGGDPAGQVGQEVYGAGAAFAFAARTFHRLPGVPFLIGCDYPVSVLPVAGRCAAMRVHGSPLFTARLRLIPGADAPLPAVTVRADGQDLAAQATPEGHQEFAAPGGTEVEVRW